MAAGAEGKGQSATVLCPGAGFYRETAQSTRPAMHALEAGITFHQQVAAAVLEADATRFPA